MEVKWKGLKKMKNIQFLRMINDIGYIMNHVFVWFLDFHLLVYFLSLFVNSSTKFLWVFFYLKLSWAFTSSLQNSKVHIVWTFKTRKSYDTLIHFKASMNFLSFHHASKLSRNIKGFIMSPMFQKVSKLSSWCKAF